MLQNKVLNIENATNLCEKQMEALKPLSSQLVPRLHQGAEQ